MNPKPRNEHAIEPAGPGANESLNRHVQLLRGIADGEMTRVETHDSIKAWMQPMQTLHKCDHAPLFFRPH